MSDELTTARCSGGPLDGQSVTTRFGDGFLAVDKQAGLAWMYTRSGDGFAVCLDHDDSLIVPQGLTDGTRQLDLARAWAAGEGMQVEVIAVGGD